MAIRRSTSKTTKTTKPAAKPPKTAARSPVKRFRALVNRKDGGEVCSINVPFDVEKTFGARGRVPVRGTLNGAPFRSSVFRMGGDCHFLVVNRQMREAAGVRGGEIVPVTMQRDTEARTITPPADFAHALKANKGAQAAWDKMSYTHKKEIALAIEAAKKPETRQRRVGKAIEELSRKKARD